MVSKRPKILFFSNSFSFFSSTPSSSPFFLGFFLFPFLRSCLKPFRAPSLVFFRLTRVQSMFSRNPHPLRPTGFSFLFFSPVYLLLKLRSALKEIPHKISFYASQYIIEYNSYRDMNLLKKIKKDSIQKKVFQLKKSQIRFLQPKQFSNFRFLLSSSSSLQILSFSFFSKISIPL